MAASRTLDELTGDLNDKIPLIEAKLAELGLGVPGYVKMQISSMQGEHWLGYKRLQSGWSLIYRTTDPSEPIPDGNTVAKNAPLKGAPRLVRITAMKYLTALVAEMRSIHSHHEMLAYDAVCRADEFLEKVNE